MRHTSLTEACTYYTEVVEWECKFQLNRDYLQRKTNQAIFSMQPSGTFDSYEVLNGTKRPIEELATESLPVALEASCRTQIQPSDPVFSSTRDFWRLLQVDEKCLRNHLRLMMGYLRLPVTLLLNPCRCHSQDFRGMFGKKSALGWLEQIFDRIGLDIEFEVSIWDILPMMSDEWFESMIQNGREVELGEMIIQGYELIGSYLESFRPPGIVVLQCATHSREFTRYPFLRSVHHPLAHALCSSIDKALGGECETMRYRGHEFWVVPGFHPSAINYEPDAVKRNMLATTLEKILFSVYQPYVHDITE